MPRPLLTPGRRATPPQADDCEEVLRPDDTPRYRLRYRLCALHLRADVVLSRGVPSRFCQARAALHTHAPFLLARRAARDVLTPAAAR